MPIKLTFMKQQLLFLGAFLFAGLCTNAQQQKSPFLSNDVPQITIEARVAVPMPESAFDGFNEIPKNPLNSSNQGNTEFVQLRELIVERQVGQVTICHPFVFTQSL